MSKIIRINSCFKCPFSKMKIENYKVFCVCESGANFDHKDERIKNDDIPKWCPLDDE